MWIFAIVPIILVLAVLKLFVQTIIPAMFEKGAFRGNLGDWYNEGGHGKV